MRTLFQSHIEVFAAFSIMIPINRLNNLTTKNIKCRFYNNFQPLLENNAKTLQYAYHIRNNSFNHRL